MSGVDIEPSDRREQARSEGARTVRFAGLVGAGLLASRVLGLVRDILLAYFLGTAHVAEAWMVAFRIPNVLRMFLTEGSMNSAFVPVLNEYLEKHPRKEVKRLINSATSSLSIALLAITAGGILFAPYLVPVIAPGFTDDPGKVALTARLMRWTFVYLFFVTVAALLMGVLQSLGRFGTSAIAPTVYNVVTIVAIFAICPLFGDEPSQWIYGLVVGTLLAGIIQIGIQIPPLARERMLPRPTLHLGHPGARRIGRLIVPTLFGVGVSELTIIANTLLASLLATGAVAAIEYATRIIQVPYMVCAAGLSTAMLPMLSRQSARGEHAELMRAVSSTLRALTFLMVPLAVITVMLAAPIVRLLLERGAFDAESTARTSLALVYFAPLLLSASTLRITTTALFAVQDTRTPVWAGVATLLLNIIVGVTLMWPMDVGGLTLAISLAPFAGSLVLLRTLVKRYGRFPTRGWGSTLTTTLVGSLGVIVIMLGCGRWTAAWSGADASAVERILAVLVPAGAGLAGYVAVAAARRSWELEYVRRTLFRRRTRRRPSDGESAGEGK